MHISWSDIQTIEALVRTRNLVAAAKSLSLQHSSVSRRIAAIERVLGAPLFIRGHRLTPTTLARRIAEHAATMTAGARAVELVIEAEQRARADRVVITTNDALAPLVLDALATCEIEPRVELVVSDQESELEPGVTDLAVRPSRQPRTALRGSRVGKLRIGTYRPRALEPSSEYWVLPSPALRARASTRWLRAIPTGAPSRVECDSVLAMRDACVAGLGRAVLPACLAVDEVRLIHEGNVEGGTPVWVLASGTRWADKRLKRLAEKLAKELRRLPGIWEG